MKREVEAALPTAGALAHAVKGGLLSAVSVLEQTLERIDALNGTINAFTSVTRDRARREAVAIDTRLQAGETLGPLAGVPYAVKNLFDIEGEVTVAGGQVNENNPAALSDAFLVAKMQAAGGVLVGALNMDEHAYGFTTENTHYGVTRNPHDTARIAGGSSGGSGAAVAAGFVPIALGSDTNGSIRVPSSLCGVFGLKPTYGRLSRSGSFPFVYSLDHLGPIASDVSGLACTYDALQGADRRDHACANRPFDGVLHDIDLPIHPLRVAILGGYFEQWAGPLAKRALSMVGETLLAGKRVMWEDAELARAAAFVITAAEGGALHQSALLNHYDDYEPHSRDRLVAGSLVPASWLIKAQRIRAKSLRSMMALFNDYDLLLAPATPVPATIIGTETMEINGYEVPLRASMGLLTQPISCIGLPVCTVPIWPPASAGPTLPIGVQLIAAPWREDVCLRAARLLETAGIATTRATLR